MATVQLSRKIALVLDEDIEGLGKKGDRFEMGPGTVTLPDKAAEHWFVKANATKGPRILTPQPQLPKNPTKEERKRPRRKPRKRKPRKPRKPRRRRGKGARSKCPSNPESLVRRLSITSRPRSRLASLRSKRSQSPIRSRAKATRRVERSPVDDKSLADINRENRERRR